MFLNLLYLCGLVLLSPWLVWRAWRTGRYRRDVVAKLCGISKPRSAIRPAVWFHGVSVGEIHLLVTVIGAFRKRHPEIDVVVSATTETGLAEARSKFADLTVIPYPFDFTWACRNTILAMRPQLVVLAESELWPNFLAVAHQERVPVVVINGRMSPRSFARLSRVAPFARSLTLGKVSAFAMQSEEYADRLRQLGVSGERIHVTGSVKFDGATGERDTPKGRELARLLGVNAEPVLILLAGSTHPPEEEILLRVFGKMHSRYPQLRLILVPRHPDRFAEVAALVSASGLGFVRRSQITDALPKMPPVVLLDTVGELGAAWGLVHLGYTGGSLDGKRGGQSMIEPAGYGVPVVFGPHVWNFRDAARGLVDVGGAKMVKNEEELFAALEDLIADEAKRKHSGSIASEFVKRQQGATARTLDVLDAWLG